MQSLKLIRNPAAHSTEPQSLDFSNHTPFTDSISQSKSEKEREREKETHKEIEDENSGPINISALGKNHIISESDEEVEPQGRISIEVSPACEESTISIETRYCTVCNIEQPLRAKHCRICNVCIALYDHHCPWMGNCIGERNRFYFWWYLVIESLVLDWSLYLLFGGLEKREQIGPWIESNWMVVLGFVVNANFAVMVTFLLGFHSYLAMSNKTTWEQLSWDKIGYIVKWPRHLGSPFTRGVVKNLQFYCCKPLPKGYTMWIYPSKIPT